MEAGIRALRLPGSPLRGIKLVVCDMDGTALNEKKEFSPATLKAFAALRERGIAYTIASARTPMMLELYLKQAKISGVPLIALEGAVVIDPKSKELLYDCPLDEREAVEICTYCHDACLDYTIYTSRSCYMRRDTRRMWRFDLYNRLAAEHGVEPVPTAVYEEATPELIAGERVYKIFVDNPDDASRMALEEFLPTQVVSIAGMYLSHVGEDPSPQLLLFGLFFSIYFPMRATNTLMRAVRTAYHLGPPRGAVRHVLKSLLYTVVLIVTIAVTLALMTVGDRLLLYAVENFRLPLFLAELWARLRFPVSAVAGYFALFFLYALAQDVRQPWRNIWPGTLTALAAWLALSWLYAYYVDNIAHYSLLYGSIGAVIVLLIWLYMSAAVLIMGAELNGTLISLRKDGRGEV